MTDGPRELGVALIGYAFMGRAHSNAWRQVGRFFEPKLTPRMKVICGRNRPAVRKAARNLGWEEHATDWREVVARDDIDIVDVSTPGDTHAEIAIAAAKAGKAVLCEKPLANDVARGEADAGRGPEGRRGPHALPQLPARPGGDAGPASWSASGKLGQDPPLPRHLPAGLAGRPRAVPLIWRFDKKIAGSGALGDIALPLPRPRPFVLGSEVVEVAGVIETFVKQRPLPRQPEEEGPGHRGRRGRSPWSASPTAPSASIEGTRFAPGRKNYNRFEINGSHGSAGLRPRADERARGLLSTTDPAGRRASGRSWPPTPSTTPTSARWWPPGHIIGYEHTFTHTVLRPARGDRRRPLAATRLRGRGAQPEGARGLGAVGDQSPVGEVQ